MINKETGEHLKKMLIGSELANRDYEQLLIAVKFIESYLSHSEEWPEEKDKTYSKQHWLPDEKQYTRYNLGYNQALKDCRLALLKRLSVERIGEILWSYLHTVTLAHDNQPNEPHRQVIFKEDISKLIQAIYSAIMEEK